MFLYLQTLNEHSVHLFPMTNGPFLVKLNTGPDEGAHDMSIDPTTSKMRAHLSENEHFYGWRGNGHSLGSTPPFSTTSGPFLVKLNAGPDAGAQDASIDGTTSEMYAVLSKNE